MCNLLINKMNPNSEDNFEISLEQVTLNTGEDHDISRVSNRSDNEEPLNTKSKGSYHLLYGVEDIPPWHIPIIYSLQILMATLSGPMITVYMLYHTMCPEGDYVLFAEMMSNAILISGICSIIQCTFGVRLPVFQGSSLMFLPPIVAMMADPEWKEPDVVVAINNGPVLSMNSTNITGSEICLVRMQYVSGSLIAASVVQVVIGVTGVMGFIMSYIGPLTIAPCLGLIGIALVETMIPTVQIQWGIASMTIVLYMFFAVCLRWVLLPIPSYNQQKGWYTSKFPIFRLYPQFFAISMAWILCVILTATDVFPNDPDHPSYHARTDIKMNTLWNSNWIFLPYPGRWGWPKIGPAGFLGILGATIGSILESIGDYYTTAAICQVSMPPKHAVNRGVTMEGLGSVLSGILGACHGTTTYSTVVGYISITGVASRFVYQITAVIFIIFGIFGKFGAVLALIPDPVFGGITTISLGIVTAVGLSTLKHIDIDSPRNHMVISCSFMLGLMIPQFFKAHPEAINTGSTAVDQTLRACLSIAMLVGPIIGFILDNSLPGTDEERGLLGFKQNLDKEGKAPKSSKNLYNLPYSPQFLNKFKIFSYIPCLPPYKERRCFHCKRKEKSIDYLKESCV